MKKFAVSCSLVLLSLALLVPSSLTAQTVGNSSPCTLNAILNGVTATTQIVAAPTVNGQRLKICGYRLRVKQAGSAADFGLVYGTGSNCGTGQTNLTPQWNGTASVIDSDNPTFGADAPLVVPANKAVCLKVSATPTNAQVLVIYKIDPS